MVGASPGWTNEVTAVRVSRAHGGTTASVSNRGSATTPAVCDPVGPVCAPAAVAAASHATAVVKMRVFRLEGSWGHSDG